MKENLIKLGAIQRLSELNKERDVLLNLLGRSDSNKHKAREVLASVKEVKKKKWSKEQRAKFKATMALKRNK